MIFDAHSDFGIQVYREHIKSKKGCLRDVHYENLKKSNVRVEVITSGGDFNIDGIDFSKHDVIYETINAIKNEIKMSCGKFFLIEDEKDLKQVRTTDSIGIILGLEGASVLSDSSVTIEKLYKKGLRTIILTYNEGNLFSGGCSNRDVGLSRSGKALIKNISQFPIVLDLAHISEKAFFEITEMFDYPLIVSHGNLKTFSKHFRNLTDEQIRILCERKGVIGLSMISLFIDNNLFKRTTVDCLLDQIDYFKNTFGISSIGIGADFMDYIKDIVEPYFKKHEYPSTIYTYPTGIESIGDIYILIDRLKERGYKEAEISKISYDNMESLFLTSLSRV